MIRVITESRFPSTDEINSNNLHMYSKNDIDAFNIAIDRMKGLCNVLCDLATSIGASVSEEYPEYLRFSEKGIKESFSISVNHSISCSFDDWENSRAFLVRIVEKTIPSSGFELSKNTISSDNILSTYTLEDDYTRGNYSSQFYNPEDNKNSDNGTNLMSRIDVYKSYDTNTVNIDIHINMSSPRLSILASKNKRKR